MGGVETAPSADGHTDWQERVESRKEGRQRAATGEEESSSERTEAWQGRQDTQHTRGELRGDRKGGTQERGPEGWASMPPPDPAMLQAIHSARGEPMGGAQQTGNRFAVLGGADQGAHIFLWSGTVYGMWGMGGAPVRGNLISYRRADYGHHTKEIRAFPLPATRPDFPGVGDV